MDGCSGSAVISRRIFPIHDTDLALPSTTQDSGAAERGVLRVVNGKLCYVFCPTPAALLRKSVSVIRALTRAR